MPYFARLFTRTDYREDIRTILQRLQTSTRIIQSHCAESKANKAVGSLAQLPHVKKQLETLVYRVKAMFAKNKCSAAFAVGDLKHKSASGALLPSQIAPIEDEDEDDEESAGKSRRKRKKAAADDDVAEMDGFDVGDEDDAGEVDEEEAGEEDEDEYEDEDEDA